MTELRAPYTVKIKIVAQCASCRETQAVLRDALCARCGEPLPAEQVLEVRAAVKARRSAFKSSLERLGRRIEAQAGIRDRGDPLSDHGHLTRIMQPALDWMKDSSSQVKLILGSCFWDPANPEDREYFANLVRELDRGLEQVEALRSTMPPALWRGVHRAIARSGMSLVRAQYLMASLIVAADYNQALELRGKFDRHTAEAAMHAERVADQIDMIRRSPDEGAFRLDGSVDFAAVAWTGVGGSISSIAQAADLVRSAFAGVPGIDGLAEEHALALLPGLSMSARIADYELLIARAQALRAALDAADGGGAWVGDPGLLAHQFISGTNRVTEETARLALQWKAGLPRRHVMRTMTEAYRELVEGALRGFGGVVLIAGRAGRKEPDGQYTEEVVNGIQSGEIVDEFIRLGAPCANNIDMLYRNASAHASVHVTDGGVTFQQRRIENNRAVNPREETLTDDQFLEQYLLLHEMLLALQLALYPWLASHPDGDIRAALASAPPSTSALNTTLGLLGGLAGLRDVQASIVDGHVALRGTPIGDLTDESMIGMLTLVPAAFGHGADIGTVTLDLAGLRPVVFDRGEFALGDKGDTAEGRAKTGLVCARWVLLSTGKLSDYAQAAWVTGVIADLHLRCAALAPTDRQRAAALAREGLRRAEEVVPTAVRSNLTAAALGSLTVLANFLGDPVARASLAQAAADSVAQAHRIGEVARGLRDTTAGQPDA